MALASDASEWRYGVTSMAAGRLRLRKSVAKRNAHGSDITVTLVQGLRPSGKQVIWNVGPTRWELINRTCETHCSKEAICGDDRSPDVPGKWCAKSLWTVLRGKLWRRDENILDAIDCQM